jgi:hypothetical protein
MKQLILQEMFKNIKDSSVTLTKVIIRALIVQLQALLEKANVNKCF